MILEKNKEIMLSDHSIQIFEQVLQAENMLNDDDYEIEKQPEITKIGKYEEPNIIISLIKKIEKSKCNKTILEELKKDQKRMKKEFNEESAKTLKNME